MHLQAFRIGDILFTVCSCEQWADQSRNIKTRTDRVAGNEHLGYDWKAACTAERRRHLRRPARRATATGTWTCPDPRDPTKDLPPLSDQVVERMHRQVVNPANGWNDLDYAAQADSEPTDVRQIKGNYTHDDDAAVGGARLQAHRPDRDGQRLQRLHRHLPRVPARRPLPQGAHRLGPALERLHGHAAREHGPRPERAATRAALLPAEFGDGKIAADLAVNDARAQALGASGRRGDRGLRGAAARRRRRRPRPSTQPPDIERFDGTFFTWVGGSNYTDDPRVTVQRRGGRRLGALRRAVGRDPGDPRVPAGHATRRPSRAAASSGAGRRTSRPSPRASTPSRAGRATPPGRYRFVVRGRAARPAGARVPYRSSREPFDVEPWGGITVEDLRARGRPARSASGSGPRARAQARQAHGRDRPDRLSRQLRLRAAPAGCRASSRSNLRGVRDPAAPDDPDKIEWFCDECAFRPWIDFGDAADGHGHLRAPRRLLHARCPPGRGRALAHHARRSATPTAALVGPGCVQDEFGNFNRDGSRGRGRRRSRGVDPRCRVAGLVDEPGGLPCPARLRQGAPAKRVRPRHGSAAAGRRHRRAAARPGHAAPVRGPLLPRRRRHHADRLPLAQAQRGSSRARERRKLKGRAVLILTTQPPLRAARRDARPGLQAAARRFRRLRALQGRRQRLVPGAGRREPEDLQGASRPRGGDRRGQRSAHAQAASTRVFLRSFS